MQFVYTFITICLKVIIMCTQFQIKHVTYESNIIFFNPLIQHLSESERFLLEKIDCFLPQYSEWLVILSSSHHYIAWKGN